MLNRSDQGEVDKFNKLLQSYQEIMDPSIATKRDSLMDKFEAMSDIFGDTADKVTPFRVTSVEQTDSSHKLSLKKQKKK
jgi:hypothetical protein